MPSSSSVLVLALPQLVDQGAGAVRPPRILIRHQLALAGFRKNGDSMIVLIADLAAPLINTRLHINNIWIICVTKVTQTNKGTVETDFR